MNVESFVSLIAGAKPTREGWVGRCPAHEDRRPSVSIARGQNGRVLVKCHAGCSLEAILDALGLRRSDLFDSEDIGADRQKGPVRPRREAPKPKARLQFPTLEDALADISSFKGPYSRLWRYQDREGRDVGVVIRWDGPEGKDLRPISLIGDRWELCAMPKPRPLYNLPGILREPRVLVVEGEKVAELGNSLGFPTTTSSNGSQSAPHTDWTPLHGKQIVILPDNDPPGEQYAKEVQRLTHGGTILRLPNLPEGGDLADWSVDEKSRRAKLKSILLKAFYE